ncbi:MAG: glycosyltransferase family 4 protein [Ardenticatenaceae bacterium]|nr:glycosyltransferase family 4 protein [Ardenticatenaceae bacterium]
MIILNQMAGPITWELAEDLGHAVGQVALLTGHPDTLQKVDPNVELTAAPVYQRGSFPVRAFSWVRYWVAAFFWCWRYPAQTPLLLFSNPPLLIWLGYVLKKLRGQRFTVMVHDIYPDVLVRLAGFSPNHPLIRVWLWLNRRAYQEAEAVMTLGEYMAATLGKQFDPLQTPAGRIEVIYPWVDTERIKPIPKEDNWFAREHGQVGKLTVMYSGNMGLGHDIETMIDAAERLNGRDDIHFMFIGGGPKWQLVEEALARRHLPNVTLLPWQDEAVLPYSLATADVALVSMEEEMIGLMVPSKLIYSMSAGSEIIAIVNAPCELSEWPDVKPISSGDDQKLVDQIEDIAHDKRIAQKHNSRRIARRLFERAKNINQIESLLRFERKKEGAS